MRITRRSFGVLAIALAVAPVAAARISAGVTF
jgi:hypothetical protein